jgi:DNA-directed RNA polymerase subunit H (RpoH/RPB5)
MAASGVSMAAAAGGGGAAAAAKSNLEPGVADILLRSRQTILDMLDTRGYDTSVYRNIAPEQVLTLAEGHSRALDIIVPKRADSNAPCERAVVVYVLQDRIRQKLGTFRRDIYDVPPDSSGANEVRRTDDLIVIFNEPDNDAFYKTALQMWQTEKARMTFFHIKNLVVNISKHVLVPPHRKLTAEEGAAEMERLHVTNKTQLPLIKHADPQARFLGLVPGDMVEVLRPSPTAGIARVLRICAA